MRSGPVSEADAVICAMRPSVAAIAGCPRGYRTTARAAALHARAKSVRRAVSAAPSGAGTPASGWPADDPVASGLVSRLLIEILQGINIGRFRIDRLDDRVRMLAPL